LLIAEVEVDHAGPTLDEGTAANNSNPPQGMK
jgi:hypothetical protein